MHKRKMDAFGAIMIAEGVIEADDTDHYIAAWQHLIDTGLCWKLQGWFGRTATDLIRSGVCHARGEMSLD
jgi:hypothetical protein